MRNLNVQVDQTKAILDTFLKNVGLDSVAQASTYEHSDHSGQASLHISFLVSTIPSLSNSNSHPLIDLAKSIQDKIIESDLVQYEIKKMQDKLDMANRASDELLARIEKLEKYKIHYELAYDLAQGKK